MSHHFFPSAGRENYMTRRRRYPDGLLKPLQAPRGVASTSTMNSGWNDPVILSLPHVDPLLPLSERETQWASPTVNVLPSAVSELEAISRPFGSVQQKTRRLPVLPRTPLQSMGHRSEHWYSDPIHGVFFSCVPEIEGRWTTSNRNVFRARNGVQLGETSPRVMQRLADASNGSLGASDHGFAKPHLSRSQHCWERINGID